MVNLRYFKDLHGRDVLDTANRKLGTIKDIEINERGTCGHLIVGIREGGELSIPFSEVKITADAVVLQTELHKG